MITFNKVTKKYDNIVLDSFSFDFPESGTICILGASGIGKTTILNLIAKIIEPDSGYISMDNNKKISFAFQEDRLLPWLSCKQNLIVVNENIDFCNEILERVGLKEFENKFPNEMSGGMKRRCAIARALAYDGDIYLLDEPFKGIDNERKKIVMDLIKERTNNKLCILVTHDLYEAKYMTDNIYILKNNTLVKDC